MYFFVGYSFLYVLEFFGMLGASLLCSFCMKECRFCIIPVRLVAEVQVFLYIDHGFKHDVL